MDRAVALTASILILTTGLFPPCPARAATHEEVTITIANDSDQRLRFRLIPRDASTHEPGYATADSIGDDLVPGTNVTFNLVRGMYLMQLRSPDNGIRVAWTNDSDGELVPVVDSTAASPAKPAVVPKDIVITDTPASRIWHIRLVPVEGVTSNVTWEMGREDRAFVPRDKLDIPKGLRLFVPVEAKFDPDFGLDRPIVLPSETNRATYFDLVRLRQRKTIADAYRKYGQRDGKWDEKAIRFLAAYSDIVPGSAAHGFKKEPYIPLPPDFDETRLRTLIDQGEAALSDGCSDPMVHFALGMCYLRADAFEQLSMDLYKRSGLRQVESIAREHMEKAVQGIQGSGYPPACEFRTLAGLFESAFHADRGPYLRSYMNRTIQLGIRQFIDADFAPGEERVAFHEVEDAFSRFSIESFDATYASISNTARIGSWSATMLQGLSHELAGASMARMGDGAFHHQMGLAAGYYAIALSNNPAYPEAAAKLVQLSMGNKHVQGRSIREWFDRAVAIDPGYPYSYVAMLNGLVPRKGGQDETPMDMYPFGELPGFTADRMGSFDAMYRFGLMCADTRRYDTVAPLFCMVAFRGIETRSAAFKVFDRPGAYDAVTNAMHQTALHPSHARDRDWLLSLEAALAFKYGRQDDARRLLQALGARSRPDAFAYMALDLDMVRQDLDAESD